MNLSEYLKSLRVITREEAEFEKTIKAIKGQFVAEFRKQLQDAPTEKRSVLVRGSNGIAQRKKVDILQRNDAFNKFILQLPKAMERALKQAGFTGKAQQYIKSFASFEAATASFHAAQNEQKLDGTALTRITKSMQDLVEIRLTHADGLLTQTVLAQVSDTLRSAVVNSVPLATTIDQIGDFLAGKPDEAGEFSRQATVIARDGYRQYQGAINTELAGQFGYNGLRYFNSIVDESRPQCKRWVEKEFIRFDELQDEIDWAYTNGTGMMPDTTVDNFLENLGGYNCRHYGIPTFIEEPKNEAE